MTHIIFDLDGTLIDSVPGIQWSVETALKAAGIIRPCPDLTPLIGPPIRAILSIAAETDDPATLDHLERNFRAAYDTEGWRLTRSQPGVEALLNRLRAECRTLFILTNKPALATNQILRELNLHHYFHEVVAAGKGSKKERLVELLNRQKIAREDCILVGDTREDYEAANAAGIPCAIVPHGYGRDLPQNTPRLNSWQDLP